MIAFVTSLRHPATVGNPDLTLALLRRTLASVCAQTWSDLRVIVVCNRKPGPAFHDSRVEYLEVDLPAPARDFSSLLRNVDAIREDRGRKYLSALYRLRTLQPSHVMFFDADDCISDRLAEIVASGPSDASWCLDDGYIHREGSPVLYRVGSRFHERCGTCFVFARGVFDLPENPEEVSPEWLKRNLGSHRLIHPFLRSKGVTLRALPFPGAIYIIGTGENHSGTEGYRSVLGGSGPRSFLRLAAQAHLFRPLTPQLRREFSLYPL